jgi:squalene cyclase
VHDTHLLEEACLKRLIDSQLPEGGWPFLFGGQQAATEPTALALLALPQDFIREREAAIRFLLEMQNPNGSWPAFAGDDKEGSGYTGLVLYVFVRANLEGKASDRAVEWLLGTQGWESHWLWRWKFHTTDRHVRFDPDKFGWPWTPETVSWVIPTAYSLLGLRQASAAHGEKLRQLRIRRGIEMLYDRICPGGGWNAGNGVVYGSALAPHLDATAIALLALAPESANGSIDRSLEWLERSEPECFAPWSDGWSILALGAYRRPTDARVDRLCANADPGQIEDCGALAVVSLVLRCAAGSHAFGGNS